MFHFSVWMKDEKTLQDLSYDPIYSELFTVQYCTFASNCKPSAGYTDYGV